MKQMHSATAVEVQAAGPASAFNIRAGAQAFRILSDTLYSDKIGAVLREIGCNARDSHVMAGCAERPIEVKLPNAINPEFYIRDFGIGLSDPDVREMYTTYFASTKGDSNDQVGAFGLGSKSPFAYVDQFTVISAFAGVRRVYAAYIGKQDIPEIRLLSEGPTEEGWPTGMQIGFPVAPNDIAKFSNKAEEIFQWFEPAPRILGAELFLSEKICIPLRKNRVELHHQLGFRVIMGGVCYPVGGAFRDLEDAQPSEWLAQDGNKEFVHQLISSEGHLVLQLPIGRVAISASREALSLDARTLNNLRRYLRIAVRALDPFFEQQLRPVQQALTPAEQKKELLKAFRFADLPTKLRPVAQSLGGRWLKYKGLARGLPESSQVEVLSLFKEQGACAFYTFTSKGRSQIRKPCLQESADRLFVNSSFKPFIAYYTEAIPNAVSARQLQDFVTSHVYTGLCSVLVLFPDQATAEAASSGMDWPVEALTNLACFQPKVKPPRKPRAKTEKVTSRKTMYWLSSYSFRLMSGERMEDQIPEDAIYLRLAPGEARTDSQKPKRFQVKAGLSLVQEFRDLAGALSVLAAVWAQYHMVYIVTASAAVPPRWVEFTESLSQLVVPPITVPMWFSEYGGHPVPQRLAELQIRQPEWAEKLQGTRLGRILAEANLPQDYLAHMEELGDRIEAVYRRGILIQSAVGDDLIDTSAMEAWQNQVMASFPLSSLVSAGSLLEQATIDQIAVAAQVFSA